MSFALFGLASWFHKVGCRMYGFPGSRAHQILKTVLTRAWPQKCWHAALGLVDVAKVFLKLNFIAIELYLLAAQP